MVEHRGLWAKYLFAILTCAMALLLGWELESPSSSFLLAAMISSLYGGRGPGYMTVAVSTVLFDYFSLLPRFHFLHFGESLLRFLVFISAMVFASELIAARRRTEESLRQTEAKLARATQRATAAELSASVIHEINQPLSALVSNGQACLRWLTNKTPNIPNAIESAERVVRDGKDAGEVIKGLRTLFRRCPPAKAPVDLKQIVNEVIVLVHGKAVREGVEIETNLPKDLPKVLGDRIQLQQVLMNLTMNALESMQSVTDRAKTLEIRARDEAGMVLTEISDRGSGIHDFDRIFETFFTTKEDGMGMGLSICKSIIEAHEGRLWGTPGRETGTVFSFTIPRMPGETQ